MTTEKKDKIEAWIENGGRVRFGELTLNGEYAHTYDKELAKIDRSKRIVWVNSASYSKTSTRHRNLILGAIPGGWELRPYEPES